MDKEKESELFSNELIETLNNKKDESHCDMKRYVDGEPKNIDPLKEIPKPQMRLYGFSGVFNSSYFDTEEELIEYVKNHNIGFGSICVMDYLGKVAGRNDVIRLTYKSGKQVLYTAVDEDGYGIYNHERSYYKGEFVWEYNYGSISEMYSAFRNRGIVFEDDKYAKIAESNKRLFEMLDEAINEIGPILTKKKQPTNSND